MTRIRYISASILILIGLAALFGFESFKQLFLFLSPDRDVTSFMWLLLRICLVSLGVSGAFLLFLRPLLRILGRLDRRLVTTDRRTLLFQILMLAAAVRGLVVALMPFNLWQDFQCYDDLGWQWTTDGGYFNGTHLTAYWPPGYPFWLSRLYWVFGHHPQMAAVANIFLGTATVLLAYLLVRRLWGERIGRWTLLLMAVFPSQAFFTNVLASELLFTPLFLAALLFLTMGIRKQSWVFIVLSGGIVLGLATLTRTITALFLVPVAIYWFLELRKFRAVATRLVVGLVGFLLVVTPWVVRNHYAIGRACLSSNSGINLFIGNQPSSGMGYNHRAALEFELWDPSKEAYIDSAASVRGWDYIKEKPLAFVRRGIFKSMFLYATDVDALDFQMFQTAENGDGGKWLLIASVVQSFYLVVLLLAFSGIWIVLKSRVHRDSGTWLVLMTLAYWTSVHFVFFSIGRFHYPVIPLIAALSAVSLARQIDLNGTPRTGTSSGTK